jgi:hypothetical protein
VCGAFGWPAYTVAAAWGGRTALPWESSAGRTRGVMDTRGLLETAPRQSWENGERFVRNESHNISLQLTP